MDQVYQAMPVNQWVGISGKPIIEKRFIAVLVERSHCLWNCQFTISNRPARGRPDYIVNYSSASALRAETELCPERIATTRQASSGFLSSA